ncbi:hypothetical protein [Peribacillus glennii]|nr:hypothetical protein [Peribacillus glennii]
MKHRKNVILLIVKQLNLMKEYKVDQIKSKFVSTVSHELRTPLGGPIQ